jgi:hypothetical protein
MNLEHSTPADMSGDGGQIRLSIDIPDPTMPAGVNPAPADPRRHGPAGNALRHGLTATKVLPDTLRLRTDQFEAEFRRELRPAGYLEDILVAEVARHAAGMELAGHAEGPILRYCGQQQAQLDALLDADGPIDADAIITAAVSSQPLERFGRYRRLHERGFYSALSRLRDLQASRHESANRALFARFRDDGVCTDYMLDRARQRGGVCPRCGDCRRHWLTCGRWECSACGLQVGPRFGTVMEGSRLPLRTWIIAIAEVLANPAIRPEQLQQAIDVRRIGTVRKVLTKIVEATKSVDVDRLLVGLQRLAPGAVSPDFCDALEWDVTKRAGGSGPRSTERNSLWKRGICTKASSRTDATYLK